MKWLAIFAAAFLMAGCAAAPKQQPYWLSWQQKMQASEHWNVLANKVAGEVKSTIDSLPVYPVASTSSDFGHASPDAKSGSQTSANMLLLMNAKGPIFISDADRSPFGNAMRTILTTELIKRELSVTSDENSPFKLNWEVQPVFHQSSRKNNDGLLTILFIDIPQQIIFGETDWPNKEKPHSEVIITFKLMKDDRNLLRNTEIFYVNSADRDHYWDISQQPSSKSGLKTVSYSVTKD